MYAVYFYQKRRNKMAFEKLPLFQYLEWDPERRKFRLEKIARHERRKSQRLEKRNIIIQEIIENMNNEEREQKVIMNENEKQMIELEEIENNEEVAQ